MINRVSYSTTLQELKSKIWNASRLNSSKYNLHLHNSGRELAKEHCFVAHFGIAGSATLEADFIGKAEDDDTSLLTKQVGHFHSDVLIPQEISTSPCATQCKGGQSLMKAIDKIHSFCIPLLELALASKRGKAKHYASSSAPPDRTSWTPVMGEAEIGHFGFLLGKVSKQILQGDDPPDEVFAVVLLTGANVWWFNMYSIVGSPIRLLTRGMSEHKSRSYHRGVAGIDV